MPHNPLHLDLGTGLETPFEDSAVDNNQQPVPQDGTNRALSIRRIVNDIQAQQQPAAGGLGIDIGDQNIFGSGVGVGSRGTFGRGVISTAVTKRRR